MWKQLLLASPVVRLLFFRHRLVESKKSFMLLSDTSRFKIKREVSFLRSETKTLVVSVDTSLSRFYAVKNVIFQQFSLPRKLIFPFFFHFVLGEADNILKEWSTQGRKSKVRRVLTFCHLIRIFRSLNRLSRHWEGWGCIKYLNRVTP